MAYLTDNEAARTHSEGFLHEASEGNLAGTRLSHESSTRDGDSLGWCGVGDREDHRVAYNFVAADRDQLMLMPPSVADWLPEDHLAWFVLDVVAELDLSAFYAIYRLDGRGGAAYDPQIMLAVLIYAYCTGERSSRRIEKRLIEDVAFRVVAANQRPDHATLARFRANHETAVAGLFGQALAVCARADLLRPGLIAVDGTKLAANASRDANRTATQIAEQILAEAAATDAAEDVAACRARGGRAGEHVARAQRSAGEASEASGRAGGRGGAEVLRVAPGRARGDRGRHGQAHSRPSSPPRSARARSTAGPPEVVRRALAGRSARGRS